jgi:hypothetical protein
MGFNSGQLAQASLVSQIGGAASSAAGSYYSAQLQKGNLAMQAEADRFNARIAELGAESALLQGNQQVASLTLKAGQLKSRQRASMAANGIVLNEGNAAEIQASTDLMKEIDTNQILANAVRSAWGYRTQATNYENSARSARAGAAGINPVASGATTLIGNASQVASGWYSLNKSGALKGTMFELE